MQEARHYIVSGTVQGVGFRWFARNQARNLGLTGWVRNLANGNVEVWAEGSSGNLELLEKALKQGPSSAYVRELKTEQVSARGRYGDFDVTF